MDIMILGIDLVQTGLLVYLLLRKAPATPDIGALMKDALAPFLKLRQVPTPPVVRALEAPPPPQRRVKPSQAPRPTGYGFCGPMTPEPPAVVKPGRIAIRERLRELAERR